MVPPPLALPPALPSELLSYILTHQTYPTTVLICQPCSSFFASLLSNVPQHIQAQPPPPSQDIPPETVPILEPPKRHHLLVNPLQQIVAARNVGVVYIPSVSHLRAYLAVFPPPDLENKDKKAPEQVFEKPGTKTLLLLVYGLVDMHRDTSEWSAQGLGHSIAGLMEAGWRSGRRIVVMESREDSGMERIKFKGWEDKVPMLNGSVKRAGLESEDGGWSGRTVEVGRILARWFKFGRGDWEVNDDVD